LNPPILNQLSGNVMVSSEAARKMTNKTCAVVRYRTHRPCCSSTRRFSSLP
jgi:hypothetical protein